MRAPTKHRRRLPSSEYLLTGFLVCGRCGAGYTVEQAKGGRYRYYQCGRTMKEGKTACPGWRIPLAAADRAALQGILDALFDERELGRIAAWAKRMSGVDQRGLERQGQELRRWENDLNLRRERILDALETGKIASEMLAPRLARLDAERERLMEKRQALERTTLQAAGVPSVDRFREYGRELRQQAESGPIPATKLLLRRFVRRILAANGLLKAELVIEKHRFHSVSHDEFAFPAGWWAGRDDSKNAERPFRITIRVA